MAATSVPRLDAQASGPAAGTLWRWGLVVLALHGALGMAMVGATVWQIQGPQSLRVGPVQTRLLAPQPTPTARVPAPKAKVERQTRLGIVPQSAASPTASSSAPSSLWPSDESLPVQSPVSPHAGAPTERRAEPTQQSLDLTERAQTDKAREPEEAGAERQEALADGAQSLLQATADKLPVAPAQPTGLTEVTMAFPPLGLAAMPAPALLSYRLNGQEKGISYQATGELRWERNAGAYAMSLTVRAFLLGSRQWRSQGLITAQGLAPVRFSDSWRSERATHFEGAQNRIVFSSNAPAATLQPGAQDQISLYPQLAAFMAQEAGRLQPGARLQVQTATVRDALPWLLTLEQEETLQMDGQKLAATKWVCQPRNRFDAKVEFWVAAAYDWLPVRIRITQVSGSFIDLLLTGRVALPDLSLTPNPG
ncbi:DUF3108 domain-containing protein [Limnohabitans sp. Rim8]|uniref:DUF3108 domain-containing protein n=1 Tax=Limnohabitans sp. Rim8 TaxID=1100718 RepID=UPI002618A951|nr:DUF3108 domain-containing protein [Limnohabitans sp. Rim8]